VCPDLLYTPFTKKFLIKSAQLIIDLCFRRRRCRHRCRRRRRRRFHYAMHY